MKKLIIIAIAVLLILLLANVVGGYVTIKEAKKVCKFQNTYTVDGTIYPCEDK